MRLSKALCIFLMAATSSLRADIAENEYSVNSDGETAFRAKSASREVEVVVRTHEIQHGTPRNEMSDARRANCTSSRDPCSLVDLIEIKVDGKSLRVPRSVFSDLADLNTAHIRIGKREFQLTLTGGDASESYIVNISFDWERVKYRRISSGMKPNVPLEETVYHKVVIGSR